MDLRETHRVFKLAPQGGGLAGLGLKPHPFYLFDIRSFSNIRVLKIMDLPIMGRKEINVNLFLNKGYIYNPYEVILGRWE